MYWIFWSSSYALTNGLLYMKGYLSDPVYLALVVVTGVSAVVTLVMDAYKKGKRENVKETRDKLDEDIWSLRKS